MHSAVQGTFLNEQRFLRMSLNVKGLSFTEQKDKTNIDDYIFHLNSKNFDVEIQLFSQETYQEALDLKELGEDILKLDISAIIYNIQDMLTDSGNCYMWFEQQSIDLQTIFKDRSILPQIVYTRPVGEMQFQLIKLISKEKMNMGQSQYDGDGVPKCYDSLDGLARPRAVGKATFQSCLGQLDSEDIVDLACGAGHFTQFYKGLTNGEVWGMDQSIDMIELARQQAAIKGKDDIVFTYCDLSEKLNIIKKFDIVSSSFLLDHAESVEMYEDMVRAMYNLLNPKGIVIGMTTAALSQEDLEVFQEREGVIFDMESSGFDSDGKRLIFQIQNHQAGKEVVIEYFYYTTETIEKIFRKVGFEDFKWIPTVVPLAKDGSKIEEFSFNQDLLVFQATKKDNSFYKNNQIAAYNKSKAQAPARKTDDALFKRILGDISTEDILDLAYIQKMMIQSAIELGGDIHYLVSDCAELNPEQLPKFNIAVSSFLLSYADNFEKLLKFVQNVYDVLKPNSRFIGLEMNPFFVPKSDGKQHSKYGIAFDIPSLPLKDGDVLPHKLVDIENGEVLLDSFTFYTSSSSFNKAFNQVGFTDFKFIRHALPDDLRKQEEFFKDLIADPFTIGFTAIKR
ncbi:UNKNOWN [Stylonychia lemnae]|uniref:Methyltransferase domain-containing protein n=1 Tax=Stylonychia lemnae TaxID=5949 RepID=A0A078AUD0_STYLE|nr:UNKNOWN [Stylonychia lemnae]|eukprot:CDW85611.1 UNKNOWN [Stylonychia lemnae]